MLLSVYVQLGILLIVVGFNSLLALYVYKSNPKSATNKIFGLLSIVISFWLTVNFISLYPAYIDSSLFWIRFSILAAVPMSFLFFLLADTIPEDQLKISSRNLIVGTLITSATMVIAVSPFTFTGIDINSGSPNPIPGPGILPFFLVTTGFSLLSVYVLLRKYMGSKALRRAQIRIFMIGILLMLGLIIITTIIPVVVFDNNTFIPFMPIYTSIFLGLTAYAIIKHKFLEIRAIVSRSVAYTMLVLFIGLAYAATLYGLGFFAFGLDTSVANIIVSTLFALIVAFTFDGILGKIESVTDSVFFKDKYDPQILLARLSRIMASTLELKEITRLLLKAIISDMKLSNGHLLLIKNDEITWDMGVAHRGKAAEGFVAAYMKKLMYVARKKRGDDIIIYDEVSDNDTKEIMKENDMAIAFPLVVDKNPIGLMFFGEKLSGDIYSSEDIHMFKILAPEIAVAVKNSLQYDEIKQFSKTLQKKVKEATADLREANKKLKVLDKMKDDFVSVASHELRTPMTAIKSYLWMTLAGKGGKVAKKQKYYLDRAYKSTDRLIKLVNDMLNISRIESGRISINPEKVDIDGLVQEVIEEVGPRAQELKLHVRMLFGDDKKHTTKGSDNKIALPDDALSQDTLRAVVADRNKVKEVLFNLIGNSLKFTPEGGEVGVYFTRKGDDIITNVRDTGRGIDKKDMSTLFTKFGMVEGSYATNKKASGTGLGLFISKSIIEFHGGEITVESDGLDKGATFSFSLPMYKKEILKKLQEEEGVSGNKEVKSIIHSGL